MLLLVCSGIILSPCKFLVSACIRYFWQLVVSLKPTFQLFSFLYVVLFQSSFFCFIICTLHSGLTMPETVPNKWHHYLMHLYREHLPTYVIKSDSGPIMQLNKRGGTVSNLHISWFLCVCNFYVNSPSTCGVNAYACQRIRPVFAVFSRRISCALLM